MTMPAWPRAAVIIAAALFAATALAHEAASSDQAEIVKVRPALLPPAPPRIAVTVDGLSSAIRLDVHHATLEDILSALAGPCNLTHSSSIALADLREGTYSGSLERVISRLLDGYDYVIRRERDHLDLWVLGKSGEQATPSPTLMRARQHQVPTTTRISRNR
jgi:hypothetical protein